MEGVSVSSFEFVNPLDKSLNNFNSKGTNSGYEALEFTII
jgi:hypothetical protein